jgi:hypothetical protein
MQFQKHVKDTMPSTTIYLHGTSYRSTLFTSLKTLCHQQPSVYMVLQQEYIIYFVIYFFFLCFVSGAACFFVKHVQTGMCINDTRMILVKGKDRTLFFVELSNNCLDPAAQSRFLDNGALLNLKRKICFRGTNRSSDNGGYNLPMLYLVFEPSSNCPRRHAITQTPWGGLYVYYTPHKQTRCAVPGKDIRLATNQGIDPYIGLTTNCTDGEDKRFNFGKLFLFVFCK